MWNGMDPISPIVIIISTVDSSEGRQQLTITLHHLTSPYTTLHGIAVKKRRKQPITHSTLFTPHSPFLGGIGEATLTRRKTVSTLRYWLSTIYRTGMH